MEEVFSSCFPNATHMLAFTDNTGTEWAARRESPSAPSLQRIAAARAESLDRRGLYVRACRVSSGNNVWADDLSRQCFTKVKSEAEALGLSVVIVHVPPSLRSTEWLLR